MKISNLVNHLEEVKQIHGDIEVTVTASTLPDDCGDPIPDVYESTAETLKVQNDASNLGHRVRILQ